MPNFLDFLIKTFPLAVPIVAVSVLDVATFGQGPLHGHMWLFLLWLVLKNVSSFVFGSYSDKKHRKIALMISQFLGAVGCLMLYAFNQEKWICFVVALLFNPLPVSRAAMLDKSHNLARTRVLSYSFLLQYAPWAIFNQINSFSYDTIVLAIVIAMLINSILVWKGFEDSYDAKSHKLHDKHPLSLPLLLVLGALVLAESGFYTTWDMVEMQAKMAPWLSATGFGTIVGMLVSMIYPKLNHSKVVGLVYFLCASVMSLSFFLFESGFAAEISAIDIFIFTMAFLSILGGLYLPLVAENVIDSVGAKHRGFGSALIELCDSIATNIGFGASFLLGATTSSYTFVLFMLIYLAAACLQRASQGTKKAVSDRT